MTVTRTEDMIDMIADEGKDLIKYIPLEDGTTQEMRAKRVSAPPDAALWEEVDEVIPISPFPEELPTRKRPVRPE